MTDVSYKARVIDGALNVRSQPDSSAPRVGRLMVNTEVDVTGEGDGWLRIAFDGGQAYAMAKFLNPVSEGDAKETVTVDRARLEAVYDELGDILGLRG